MGFDFETPYLKYPRRGEGKKNGMLRLQQTIKTEDQYKLFCQALDNYVELCRAEKRQRKFVLLWKTFVNNWEDYLELDGPPDNDNDNQLMRILKGEI